MTHYISRAETAARLGVTPKVVDRLRSNGKLPSVKIGRAVRIDSLAVTALAASGALADEDES